MTEGVVVALIAGGLSLLGTIVSSRSTVEKLNQSVVQSMTTAQAVTDTKIEALAREVREHNGFAKRMPVVEEQIRVINHRIEDLEGFHKPTQ